MVVEFFMTDLHERMFAGSNPRPTAYQAEARPTELPRPKKKFCRRNAGGSIQAPL